MREFRFFFKLCGNSGYMFEFLSAGCMTVSLQIVVTGWLILIVKSAFVMHANAWPVRGHCDDWLLTFVTVKRVDIPPVHFFRVSTSPWKLLNFFRLSRPWKATVSLKVLESVPNTPWKCLNLVWHLDDFFGIIGLHDSYSCVVGIR